MQFKDLNSKLKLRNSYTFQIKLLTLQDSRDGSKCCQPLKYKYEDDGWIFSVETLSTLILTFSPGFSLT